MKQPKPKNLGGRPKGSLNKRTIAALNIEITALREGLTPVDVMLKVMYENLDMANRIKVSEKDLQAHLDTIDTSTLSAAEKRKTEHQQKALARRINMRKGYLADAASNASDAAPYIHPKLVAAKHSNDPENPINNDGSFERIADALNTLADQKIANGERGGK